MRSLSAITLSICCSLVKSFGSRYVRTIIKTQLSVQGQDENNNGRNEKKDVLDSEFAVKENLSDDLITKALKSRTDELKVGIGKRYMVRTQRGFLNVHSDSKGVYETNNVVAQLKEGQIITSIGPDDGDWVHHDNGGWSIRFYEGFTWLIEIDSYPLL